MNLKRTATIVAVGGACAAWLAAAATSGTRDIAAPVESKPAPVDVRGAALASEIAKLQDHLHPTATPSQPARNLFQFAAPRPQPAAAPIPIAPAIAEPPPAAPIKVPPALKLDGIAEDQTPAGLVRTAIVTAQGQLFLAKEGESVTLRYRVDKISAEVVELTDLGDGTTIRLALR